MAALLVIIYIAFISLGLPDSILGSAWPAMRGDMHAHIALAGYVAMAAQTGTIVSSLMSTRLLSRFGTGKVTSISVALTAFALFGISSAPSVPYLFACALPLGLGAGAIDSVLNNFVAKHYEAKHMNWLHCFWGIGATIGPAIMSASLLTSSGWRSGYMAIALIQSMLVIVLFCTLPLWRRAPSRFGSETDNQPFVRNRDALQIPGVRLALIAFVFFCATEATTGLWTSSYLVTVKGVSKTEAAGAASLFYGAITLGRFISGFVAGHISSPKLIRIGQLVCVFGASMLILPLPTYLSVVAIGIIGFGTAPIFPSMIHETPVRFGAASSQAVIGLQMAFAYIGATCFPPLFGSLSTVLSMSVWPWFVLVCILGMLVPSEVFQARFIAKSLGN